MSMTSVAAPIWNEIAKTQKLRTPWARKAFSLDAEAMNEQENREYQSLKEKIDPVTAASYLDVRPLLLENVAISRFTQGQPQYRDALPEVTSIAEAIALASKERPLNLRQQTSLRKLLAQDLS